MEHYVWYVIIYGVIWLFYRHGWEKIRPPDINFAQAPSDEQMREIRRRHQRINWPQLFAGGGRSLMAAVISFAVLGAALYIILSRTFSDSEQKWAFGAIGTIMGYWLKA